MFPPVAFLLSVVAAIAQASQASPQLPPPAATDDLASAFSLDLQYARLNGFVQVREGTLEGERLALHDLGMDDAAVAALEYDHRLSDESRLRMRMRWYYAAGSASFDHEIVFNAVRYETDATLHSFAELGDLSAIWERDLFRFGDGGRVAFLGGLNYVYLNFKINGSAAADTGGLDKKEDFWKQSLPLPVLGVRVDWPLTPASSLYAEAYGFRAIHWNSLRSEGGTVYLSQDNVEATLGWAWRMSPRSQLDAGLRFDYLMIDETSHEDGNQYLMRSFGPFIAYTLRF